MLVLAIQGRISADLALFSNVGDDSEHPATLRYFHEVAVPYAAQHDFPLHELHRTWRIGPHRGQRYPTLLQHVVSDRKSVVIPVWMPEGAPGTRYCTDYWKIRVVRAWLRDAGVTAADPATILIGFSLDEVRRMKDGRDPLARRSYPLIDLGLDRAACARVVADAGLQVPPKSSCYFCPFRGAAGFNRMRHEEPEQWARAVELERVILRKRAELGRDPAYLSGAGMRLDQLPEQLSLLDDDPTCDAWSCFT